MRTVRRRSCIIESDRKIVIIMCNEILEVDEYEYVMERRVCNLRVGCEVRERITLRERANCRRGTRNVRYSHIQESRIELYLAGAQNRSNCKLIIVWIRKMLTHNKFNPKYF
jgi:hypothetical protein